jgi:hypothetical protein
VENDNNENILEGFLEMKDERGRLYKVFSVSSLIFIFCMAVDLVYDVQGGRSKRIDWEIATPLLGLPVLGMIFHLASKKVGWIINVFYYLVVSLAFCYGFYTEYIETNSLLAARMPWRFFIFMILSIMSTVLLFSNELRRYFKVSGLLLIILCIVSVTCTVLLLRNG